MSQNLAEVRAAAEIVRYWLSHPDADEPIMEEQEERGHAAQDIADFILSHIPADAELPVTAEWLREEWGFENIPGEDDDELYLDHDYMHYSALVNGECVTFYFDCDDGDAFPKDITTRHQFRLLAGALGITPKKEG